MSTETAPNYMYWQQHGKGWFNEYEHRKTFIPYLHIQEILLTHYIGLQAPATVLDYGCGVGRHLRNLREIPGITIYGYDQSPAMIAEMSNWASDKWIEEHIRFGAAVGPLPFKDRTFDVVFTNEVLVHTRPEDLEAVLRELLRVTRSCILHLEPGPETPLIADAHSGCWAHDLIAAYQCLGLVAVPLPPLFSSQIPIEIRVDRRADAVPLFSEPTCRLFRNMETALTPILNRGIYEDLLSRAAAAASDLGFTALVEETTETLRTRTEAMSREQLAYTLSVLIQRFQDLRRNHDKLALTEQKLRRRIGHLENHVAYVEGLFSRAAEVDFSGFIDDGTGPAGEHIALDILPEPNAAAQGCQVWIRYIKLDPEGPMLPWSAVTLTPGWRLMEAEGCMYDQALLGEAAVTLMVPSGTDPVISFMGHPWSGRLSLKWREREHIVDLYRSEATDITIRLLELT